VLNKYFDAVVLSRRPLTERIAEFCIGAADGSRLRMAEAGSHIELRFGGEGGQFLRHYSIVGPLDLTTSNESFWRIAVQRENRARGSAYIHTHFRPGSRLKISNPISAFRLARDPQHCLLVAGGIGVTPLVAMARSLRMRGAQFSMFYAGIDESSMAYAEELREICGKRLTLHESRAAGIPDLRQLLLRQPEGTTVYICGPGAMIEVLREAATALGWSKDRVRFEIFNAAHKPDDEDFVIQTRSGRVIKVGAGTTILDALETAGVDTLSDCRRGECGLCITDVLGCDGSIDHRDRYFNDEERLANKQIAICCSRIKGRSLTLDV
jgi:ferredoxin-NADP reductase